MVPSVNDTASLGSIASAELTGQRLPNRKNTVTLFGYHGMLNFGDDLFLQYLCRFFREKAGVEKLFVTAYQGRIPAFDGDLKLVPIDREWPVIGRLRWISILRRMLQSDALCFGAGTIFQYLPYELVYCAIKLARVFNPDFKVIALGVSVHPLPGSKSEYWKRRALRCFDLILVRDVESLKHLRQLGLCNEFRFAGDLALDWEPGWAESRSHQDVCRVGVFLNDFGFTDDTFRRESLIDAVVEGVRRHVTQYAGTEVLVAATCGDNSEGDVELSKQVLERFATAGIPRVSLVPYKGNQPDAFAEVLQSCDAIISSRMHPGLLGLMANIPVFQIAYARKIPDFYSTFSVDNSFLIEVSDLTADGVASFLDSMRSEKTRTRSGDIVDRLKDARRHLSHELDRAAALLQPASNVTD